MVSGVGEWVEIGVKFLLKEEITGGLFTIFVYVKVEVTKHIFLNAKALQYDTFLLVIIFFKSRWKSHS